ncbi:hypothetical protein OENI_110080 [Oenococcus oeni]|uniref:Uncharacterized protein n=1 Tax=Oenococcus oeni TaxID=1247 RepID=A0AAQ2UWB5_OENOE|nr:hypothetical protein OENI_110080 [Oenococcus oeni]SYW06821.1 hypothetical protein OENI_400009 [Oenococcus oeni]SYW15508.1 hypothetical protein OENI_10203 [Oenococcus oeni]VDB98263.1 protein of unknown function [Oenococcus oeni]
MLLLINICEWNLTYFFCFECLLTLGQKNYFGYGLYQCIFKYNLRLTKHESFDPKGFLLFKNPSSVKKLSHY